MPTQSAATLQRIHHPRYSRHLLLLAVLFSLAFFFLFIPWNGGDLPPVHHYAPVCSLLLDGDVAFGNDLLLSINPPELLAEPLLRITSKGYLLHETPIGSSILMAPFWLAGRAIHIAFIHAAPPDRYAFTYRFSASIAAACYGFLALLLMWRAACRFVSSRLAMVSAIATYFGSSAVTYALVQPGYPYSYQVFGASLFLYAAVAYAPYQKLRYGAAIGATSGLLLITSWRSAPFLLLPIVLLFFSTALHPWDAPPGSRPRAFSGRETFPRPRKKGRIRHLFDSLVAATTQDLYHALAVLLALAVFILMLVPQAIIWGKHHDLWSMLSGEANIPFTFGGHERWNLGTWLRCFTNPLNGLFHWHPVLIASAVGLVLLALRRNLLGFLLIISVVAATLPEGFSPYRVPRNTIGAASLALLTPFLAIGTAALLHEMRSKTTRGFFGAVLIAAAFWNIIVTIAVDKGMIRFSPLSDADAIWASVFNAIKEHPAEWFGNSLLMRYLTQAPAPLEPLLALFSFFVLFPAAAWIGLRYFWPTARRLFVVHLLVIVAVGVFLFFSWEAFHCEADSELIAANLQLRKALLEAGMESDASEAVEEAGVSDEQNPIRLVTLPYLGCRYESRGQTAQARACYRELAAAGCPAGRIGLIETARTPEQTLEAVDARSDTPIATAPPLLGRVVRAYIQTGQSDMARDYLDRSFAAPHVYWRLRAELARGRPRTEAAYLRRALAYNPIYPPAVLDYWRLLRSREAWAEADAMKRGFSAVAQTKIPLYRYLVERFSREEMRPHFGEVLPFARTVLSMYREDGQSRLAERVEEEVRYFTGAGNED